MDYTAMKTAARRYVVKAPRGRTIHLDKLKENISRSTGVEESALNTRIGTIVSSLVREGLMGYSSEGRYTRIT